MKRIFSTLLVIVLAFAMLPVSSVMADADILGPLTSAVAVSPTPVLVGGQVIVTATVDDSTTGNSAILSAEYNLNGGSWVPMNAVDVAFDTPLEAVTATFTAAAGLTEVCVRGTDVLNNVGAPACAAITEYTFRGFKPPVRMNVANKATAGQAIPLKWQVLDAKNKPVKAKTFIVGVMSYQVDCTSLAPLTDPTLELGPGKSGLKLTGSYWHFNWKTSKAYAGTCRKVFVSFAGDQKSPEVLFVFKGVTPKK
jgi:hypothetical protein